MLFCVLYTIVFWGVSITLIVKCDSLQSLDIAFCVDSGITIVVMTIVGVVTDFYILALPIKVVMSLNIKRRKKFGLAAIFLCGLV